MLTRHYTHLQVIKALAVVEGQGRRDFLFFVQVEKQDFIVTVTRQAAILQSQVCVCIVLMNQNKRYDNLGAPHDLSRSGSLEILHVHQTNAMSYRTPGVGVESCEKRRLDGHRPPHPARIIVHHNQVVQAVEQAVQLCRRIAQRQLQQTCY